MITYHAASFFIFTVFIIVSLHAKAFLILNIFLTMIIVSNWNDDWV